VALYVQAQTGYFLEDPALDEVIAYGLASLRSAGDHPASKAMLAMALMLAAESAARQGDMELAEAHFLESTTILENTATEFLPWAEYSRLLMMQQMEMDPEIMRRQHDKTVVTLNKAHSGRLAAMVESDWAHRMRREGNFEEAMGIYRRMLARWRELGHRAAMANVLENMAFIDRAENRPQKAATLLGAAERIREEAGQDMLRPEREEYERELDALQGAMPAEALKIRWARGRALSTDALIALAAGTDEGDDE
jgi:tetratricopeptide (TPR) repeat protein